MKFFPETKMSMAAKQSRWRHVWIIDILIALAIFYIAQIAQITVLLPAFFFHTIQEFDSFARTESSDLVDIPSQFQDSMSFIPDWISLLSLFLTAAVIVLCILYCTKLERRSLASVGFGGRTPIREYLAGYGIGVGMLALAWGICLATGTARLEGISGSISWMVLPFFLAFLVQGMSEEVLCRGFLMQTLSTRYAPLVAILLNSILFMGLHVFNSGLTALAFLNLFLFGVFASIYMWKRGSIWGVAAIHSAWNFTQGNLLGIRVSGSVLGPSVLSTELSETGKWMNGGSFGLEGGLSVTVVLIAAILIMLFMPVKKSEAV